MNRRNLVKAVAFGSSFALSRFAYGSKFGVGFNAQEIFLGQTVDMTASRAVMGRAYSSGAKLVFDSINSSGGIAGRKIKIVQLDDEYDSNKAHANARRLIEVESVFAMIHSVGTGIGAKLIPFCEDNEIPFIHPLTGADRLRPPVLTSKQTFFLRASYNRELEKIVQQIKTLGIENIGLVYEDEPFGQGVYSQTTGLLKSSGLKLSALGVMPANRPADVEQAVRAIIDKMPTVVIVGSAGPAVVNFIAACRKSGVTSRFFCLSVSDVDALNTALGHQAAGVVVCQVVPSPTASALPVVQQYRKAIADRGDTINAFGLEGYISGLVIERALRIMGSNISRDNFLSAMTSAQSSPIGGFAVSSNGAVRNGAPFVEMAMIRSDGRLLQ